MCRRRNGLHSRQLLNINGDIAAVIRDPFQIADHPHIARESSPVRRDRLLFDNNLNAPLLDIRLHRIDQRVILHDRIRRDNIQLAQCNNRAVDGQQYLLAHRLHPVIDLLQFQVISLPCSHTFLLTPLDGAA